LINPTIKRSEIQIIKPVLSVVVDNSESIAYFNEQKSLETILNKIRTSDPLHDKFAVNFFSFSDSFEILDSLNFLGTQTNIDKGIRSANALYKERIAPLILVSDGNQTLGNDYEFANSDKPIYPVIIGDTATYRDVKISQLNVNKYSYLKNDFPVECLLYYEGTAPVSSTFTIRNKGKRVFSKAVSFSNTKRTVTVEASLPSLQTGKNYYTASIEKITGEKNTTNNTRVFSVEVIDEQTKILVLTTILHPDIGAVKKSIETNKQRKVDIKVIGKDRFNINDYQLVILYQPDTSFRNVISDIKKYNANYFMITGTKTDWRFLNTQQLGISKNAINRSENYIADYNKNFLVFGQDDIGFNQFPPLEDAFGETLFTKPFEPMLFQNINGIPFDFPLLATLEENGQRSAILLGEGMWKWRASSYLTLNSFEDFDAFIGNLVQYLASTKIRKRLDVSLAAIFPANTPVDATAFYVDSNYKFDDRATLTMEVRNVEKTIKRELPFSAIGNTYQLSIENLPPGDYNYTVSVKGQNISSSGTFKITTFKVEEQFTNANKDKLSRLATRTGGKTFYKTEIENLLNDLVKNPAYYTTQKTISKDQNIIDWQWILIMVLSLLSVEWFIRKYYGKI
jgi:hypothetical protein